MGFLPAFRHSNPSGHRLQHTHVNMYTRYNHGRHLQAPAVDPEEAVLVERALQGMIQDVERCGTANHSSDWEVDELQEWTTVLNFEE